MGDIDNLNIDGIKTRVDALYLLRDMTTARKGKKLVNRLKERISVMKKATPPPKGADLETLFSTRITRTFRFLQFLSTNLSFL